MQRFESTPYPNRDNRSLYNPHITSTPNYPPSCSTSGGSSPLYRGGNNGANTPSHLDAGGTANRVYPPGSNPRLSCLLSSTPSATTAALHPNFDGNGGANPTFYNRPGPYNNGGPDGYLGFAQNPRATGGIDHPHMLSGGSYPGGPMGFPDGGYGSMGGSGIPGNRYHPYSQQQQQQQSQQRSGFLEQLLKNRSVQQPGYNPYSNSSRSASAPSSTGQAPSTSMGNQFYPGGNYAYQQHRGMINSSTPYNQHPNYPGLYMGGNGAGRLPASYSNQHAYPPYHLHPQLPNPWSRGGVGGFSSGFPFYQPPQQNQAPLHNQGFSHHANGSLHNQQRYHPSLQNPFQDHHPRPAMQIIKNEPEETEGQVDREVQQSEARYRRNQERMNAILNGTMANCDPIRVPMERVNSLRRHVELLKEDVIKHKQDTTLVKESCTKRLQDFKESTLKYYSDYNKYCQPMPEEEYNNLVEKYYAEMKEKLTLQQEQQKQQLQQQMEAVIKKEVETQEETSTEEIGDASISTMLACSASEGEAMVGANNASDEVGLLDGADEDFFEHPLFIDIPTEREEESGQQQENQNFSLYSNQENAFPPPPPLIPCGNNYYGGGNQQQQQQQRVLDYTGYHSTANNSCMDSGSSGGNGNNGMGNMLMQAQAPPPPPLLQPQPSMRWHQGNTLGSAVTSTSNTGSGSSNFGFPIQQEYPSFQEQQTSMRSSYSTALSTGHSAQNRPQRPTEQLHDFLLGWVQKMREDNSGDSQQRRLMSGGGIVEVKQEEEPRAQQQEETMYDDDSTRDWINALASGVVASSTEETEPEDILPDALVDDHHHDNVVHEEVVETDNNNDNLQVDLNSTALVDSSTPTTPTGKNSKIAEILESPCLNEDSVEEFESELRQQLEDALNVSNAEADSLKIVENDDEIDDEFL